MYARPDDLLERFGEREFRQLLSVDVVDAQHPRLLSACRDAAALADGYIQQAYALPLPEIPPVLVAICADLARFRLHHDQIREGGEQGKSALRLRHEEALQLLEKVAAGRLALFPKGSGAQTAAPFALRRHHRVAVVASPVVFHQQTLDKMDGAT